MEQNKWLRFALYGLSLILSIALDMHVPEVKSFLCTILPTTNSTDRSNSDYQDRTEVNRDRAEMIK